MRPAVTLSNGQLPQLDQPPGHVAALPPPGYLEAPVRDGVADHPGRHVGIEPLSRPPAPGVAFGVQNHHRRQTASPLSPEDRAADVPRRGLPGLDEAPPDQQCAGVRPAKLRADLPLAPVLRSGLETWPAPARPRGYAECPTPLFRHWWLPPSPTSARELPVSPPPDHGSQTGAHGPARVHPDSAVSPPLSESLDSAVRAVMQIFHMISQRRPTPPARRRR